MRYLRSIILATLITFVIQIFPHEANASSKIIDKPSIYILTRTKADSLIVRLNEIKLIDKSKLTRLEKSILRKEVKTINKDLVNGSGGIYLSVGAVLLLILLLVILI